jgi:hypothetical protein
MSTVSGGLTVQASDGRTKTREIPSTDARDGQIPADRSNGQMLGARNLSADIDEPPTVSRPRWPPTSTPACGGPYAYLLESEAFLSGSPTVDDARRAPILFAAARSAAGTKWP